MKTIHLLPNPLIAQIAAGEVIERPSYAVKELIDNALDASADRITIDLSENGLSKIVVTDNGIGMGKEDIVESYKLHTTSKIRNTDHLLSIKTLGFRGEALSSIASVSTLTIESKTAAETIGTRIKIRHGEPVETTSLGMPSGTRIIVEQLFENTPGRKKFLKSKRTELRHIMDWVERYAIAAPSVHFHISNEGRTIADINQTADISERIDGLFGPVSNALLPISGTDRGITVRGFVSTPQYSSETVPKQYVSINGRPISDRLISLAVKEAYGILLDNNTQPTFFLFFTLPYEMVDVNVHPRKEEVAFIDERLLFDFITKTVQDTLSSHTSVFHSPQWELPHTQEQSLTRSTLGNKLKEAVIPYNTRLLGKMLEEAPCLQLHNLYIVTMSRNGVLLIDQHAAHERILYEKFQQQFLREKNLMKRTPLSPPVTIDLSMTESLIVEELHEELDAAGFSLEPFHASTWKLTHVPEIFVDRDIKQLLMEIISVAKKTVYIPSIDSKSKKMLAFLACKSAVKAGDPLTKEQMTDILHELETLPGAVTCPHGRPVKWEISLGELNKLFKRS